MLLKFDWHDHKIVLADGCKFENVRVLVLGVTTLLVMRDELTSGRVLGNEIILDEANDTIGMRLLFVLEVKTVVHLNDVDCLLMCIVLENELLEVEECTLVVHTLSQLDLSLPCMGRISLLTIVAL